MGDHQVESINGVFFDGLDVWNRNNREGLGVGVSGQGEEEDIMYA